MKTKALLKAIGKAGGVVKLAASLKISSQAISQWEKPPAKHCLEIEKATGVSRHELRPDIYGKKQVENRVTA